MTGSWQTLPLSDVAAFNPRCEYVFGGMKAGAISTSTIQTVFNGISDPSTATWYGVNANDKNTMYIAQDNYANNLYYGGFPTGSILVRC